MFGLEDDTWKSSIGHTGEFVSMLVHCGCIFFSKAMSAAFSFFSCSLYLLVLYMP